MRLDNESGFDAQLLVLERTGQDRHATVVIKSTYDLDERGRLTRSEAQQPILASGLMTDFGVIHGERYPMKEGVDVCVLGTVVREHAVERTNIRLMVGERSWEIAVVGDRVWEEGPDGELRPSRPIPWTEMPLSYSRTYGGHLVLEDGDELLWAANPLGRGHYNTREQARGRPLANLEDPMAAVNAWSPEGKVVGWAPYPSFWALRSTTAIAVNPDTAAIQQVRRSLFNHAHPDLALEQIETYTPIRLMGVRAQPLMFWLPPPPAAVTWIVGSTMSTSEAHIDGIFIWADSMKVVFTQRAHLTYGVVAGEVRRAVVHSGRTRGDDA